MTHLTTNNSFEVSENLLAMQYNVHTHMLQLRRFDFVSNNYGISLNFHFLKNQNNGTKGLPSLMILSTGRWGHEHLWGHACKFYTINVVVTGVHHPRITGYPTAPTRIAAARFTVLPS